MPFNPNLFIKAMKKRKWRLSIYGWVPPLNRTRKQQDKDLQDSIKEATKELKSVRR